MRLSPVFTIFIRVCEQPAERSYAACRATMRSLRSPAADDTALRELIRRQR